METTFMTIHNLTPEANILFASESIVDVLGYYPDEVTGKSCFDYFHPDEVPFARGVHNRGVMLDKAAVLHYASIKDRNGNYVACECVFSIVHDVIVACTSIYRGDEKNERRAQAAPTIRRLFASSPRDPRYHMLEHLSAKFRISPDAALREPRAALILNRFTRTLTVMYATNAVSTILGVSPEQFKEKSFYECIQENCLPEAIRCLESAKANDSIAYLRFWYRDPRRAEDFEENQANGESSSDSEDGGVELDDAMDIDFGQDGGVNVRNDNGEGLSVRVETRSRAGNGISSRGSDLDHNTIFDQAHPARSSTTSSVRMSSGRSNARQEHAAALAPPTPFEIEAVVSCTSDGLVVILRRARPVIPSSADLVQPIQPQFANGLFAAPWGVIPIRPHQYQPDPRFPFQHGFQAPIHAPGGPPLDDFMNTIRDVAVFAWSLAGINGNIAAYGHGTPRENCQPHSGLPIWNPFAKEDARSSPPENQAAQKWAQVQQRVDQPGRAAYQYPYQDERYNTIYGTSSSGSDQAGSSAHAHLRNHNPAHYQPWRSENDRDGSQGTSSAGPSDGSNPHSSQS